MSRTFFVLGLLLVAATAWWVPIGAIVGPSAAPAASSPVPRLAIGAAAASRPDRGLAIARSPSPFQDGGAGSLAVEVVSDRDGSAVAGVRVEVIPFAEASGGRRRIVGVTDARGLASFSDVPRGPLRIFSGETSRYWALDGVDGERLEMQVPPAPLSIVALDPGGGPLPGAMLWVSAAGHSDRGEVAGVTGPDGRLVLPCIAAGKWIAARAPGLAWSVRSQPEEPARGKGPRELRVALGVPGRSVRGSVADARGNALPGAWIGCRRVGDAGPGPPLVESAAGADGTFEAVGLSDGSWIFEAWLEDHAPALASVEVGLDGGGPVALVLGDGVTIEGCARDVAGRPLERVQVTARSEGSAGRMRAVTAADGRYRIAHAPATIVAVRAGWLAGERVSASLDLRTAPRVVWDPVLDTGRVLMGVVRDERGASRPFVLVRAAATGPKASWVAETVADREGRFEIANAPQGPLVVEIEVPGWGAGGARRVDGLTFDGGPVAVVVPQAERPSAFVSGTVVGPDGEALPGIVVAAARLEDRVERPPEGRSRDGDGRFRIGPLAAGAHVIEAAGRGGSWHALAECVVAAGEERELGECRLRREGFLRVLLAREAKAPRSQRLEIVDRLGRPVAALRPVGDFAVSGPLAPGSYALRIGGVGVAPATLAFDVKDADTTTLEVPIGRSR